jgi:hypothetical protein
MPEGKNRVANKSLPIRSRPSLVRSMIPPSSRCRLALPPLMQQALLRKSARRNGRTVQRTGDRPPGHPHRPVGRPHQLAQSI